MATRSEIIKKAKDKIVQASEDPYWSEVWWNDKYHQACEYIRKEIVDSELNYFMVINATIAITAENEYALPSDCDSLLWVKNPETNENYNEVDLDESNHFGYAGYKIINDSIVMVNFDSVPATLKIDYYRKIKEIGDWNGEDDPTTGVTAVNYVQHAPLDTASAARTISDLLVIYAMAKDETLTPAQTEMANLIVSTFVNKLGTRNKQTKNILGY